MRTGISSFSVLFPFKLKLQFASQNSEITYGAWLISLRRQWKFNAGSFFHILLTDLWDGEFSAWTPISQVLGDPAIAMEVDSIKGLRHVHGLAAFPHFPVFGQSPMSIWMKKRDFRLTFFRMKDRKTGLTIRIMLDRMASRLSSPPPYALDFIAIHFQNKGSQQVMLRIGRTAGPSDIIDGELIQVKSKYASGQFAIMALPSEDLTIHPMLFLAINSIGVPSLPSRVSASGNQLWILLRIKGQRLGAF